MRRAVENRYFAFSSYHADHKKYSGRIQTLHPELRRVAEERRSQVHSVMAEYFKRFAGRDDHSDLQAQLPRAIREKNYHEAKSGKKPSFLVVARVRPFVQRETEEDGIFVEIERMHMNHINKFQPVLQRNQRAKCFYCPEIEHTKLRYNCNVNSKL